MSNNRRNNVSLRLIRGNRIPNPTTKPDYELYKQQVALGGIKEEMVAPALVINTHDYPVNIKYGDYHIRLSPRSRQKVADHGKLDKDSIPAGIVLKLMEPKKAKAPLKSSQEEKVTKKVTKKKNKKSKKTTDK